MESVCKIRTSLMTQDWKIALASWMHTKMSWLSVNSSRYDFRVLSIRDIHHTLIIYDEYIENFLSANQDMDQICQNICLIQLLSHIGFQVHPTKSKLKSVQKIVYMVARFILHRGLICPIKDRSLIFFGWSLRWQMGPSALFAGWWRFQAIWHFTNRGKLHLRPIQAWSSSTVPSYATGAVG